MGSIGQDLNADRGPPIGVLAGMGVKSTAPFLELFIEECRSVFGARREMDFPPMMIHTVPVPYDADGPMDAAAVRDTMLGGLRRLDATGVRFIAIPCNTAHIYFDDLSRESSVPLVDMIDEAAKFVPETARHVALLATGPTVESGLYQDRLAELQHEVVWSEELQSRVEDVLIQIKTGLDPTEIRRSWDVVTEAALGLGAECALLACTDLNAVPAVDRPAPGADGVAIVDATRALARAVALRWTTARQPGLRAGTPA